MASLLAIVAALGVAQRAVAQDDETTRQHSGDVTIEARHPTALEGIDDLLFTVTRSVAADYDLEVPVTLSSGIFDPSLLSNRVTIAANQTSVNLEIFTGLLVHRAMTGDVTATVGDGVLHDVGDPSSASVRVHVGETLVTVRLNAGAYRLDESIGTTNGEIGLVAKTMPGVPAPSGGIRVSVSSRTDTATSPDDYMALSAEIRFQGSPDGDWVVDGDSYMSRVDVPLTLVDDDAVEGDETLQLLLERATRLSDTVELVAADPLGQPCESDCGADVTIVDDDTDETESETVDPPETVDPADQVVVTLVHVPGVTAVGEDERVLFRLLFAAADGGPARGGAEVELSFEWTHHSPIVPTSGQISRIVLSLPRVDVWDSSVQILDNDIGNPDGTLVARITGCERNECIIGEPSEITVTIVDDDGGPAAAPPGPPDAPRLVCAVFGDGYDPTGTDVSWSVPAFVGGAPVEGYELQYQRRVDDGGPWVWGDWHAWPYTGLTTSTTITGLEADNLYAVRVRAVNANGPGRWSFPNSFWTGYSEGVCEILDELTP